MNWDDQPLDPEILEAWREATEVPDAAVARLRTSVLASIAHPRPRFPWWKWAAPAAIAATLLLAIARQPDAPQPHAPQPVKRIAQPIVPVAPLEETPRTASPRPEPQVSQRRARKQIFQEAAYIRYETPDPDVVILLIGADGSGE